METMFLIIYSIIFSTIAYILDYIFSSYVKPKNKKQKRIYSLYIPLLILLFGSYITTGLKYNEWGISYIFASILTINLIPFTILIITLFICLEIKKETNNN